MTATPSILGTGSYLPEQRVDVERATARYPDHERIVANGYRTVAVEPELYPADMGLIAARRALAASGLAPGDIALLVFTSIHRHGHKRLWSPASWLQEALGCRRALPLNVQQGCNAQLLVLDLAADHLAGGAQRARTPGRGPGTGGGPAALVVAADRFSGSSFNRFTSDYGIVYGDGAAAAVLSHGGRGGWRIHARRSVSDPWLEGLHRADRPRGETASSLPHEHDTRSAKRGFLGRHGKDVLVTRTRSALSTLREAVSAPGPGPDPTVIYPNLGAPLLEEAYYPEFPGGAARSLKGFGETVGHLGSADQIAGLDLWTRQAAPAAGSRVLLVGAGAGFTWTGMLLDRNGAVGTHQERKKETR